MRKPMPDKSQGAGKGGFWEIGDRSRRTHVHILWSHKVEAFALECVDICYTQDVFRA